MPTLSQLSQLFNQFCLQTPLRHEFCWCTWNIWRARAKLSPPPFLDQPHCAPKVFCDASYVQATAAAGTINLSFSPVSINQCILAQRNKEKLEKLNSQLRECKIHCANKILWLICLVVFGRMLERRWRLLDVFRLSTCALDTSLAVRNCRLFIYVLADLTATGRCGRGFEDWLHCPRVSRAYLFQHPPYPLFFPGGPLKTAVEHKQQLICRDSAVAGAAADLWPGCVWMVVNQPRRRP